MNVIQADDLAMAVDARGKAHVIKLRPGARFETHHGYIAHDAVIGQPWGSVIESSLGHPYLFVPPSIADLITHIKRSSQVIYPKDSAYILMRLNVRPGARVLECGCGSGGLTTALAHAVAPHGHVFSQDVRADFIALAQRNLERVGLAQHVTFLHGDCTQGFPVPEPVDAVFLDLPTPEICLVQARAVLKDGGFFGALVPTTNQVVNLLRALEQARFGLVEVEEILLRRYKPVPERLRPQDRMVAHTGYLVFARAIVKPLPTPPTADEAEPTDLA
ncbi:MAG: tRNA (adenine-N1)-methyltransferase [Thermoflexales bacterium]|nr:tRNA (adenine-N1)-methyltransferase [Thermoflexales bacterium]MCS7324241.1 tRNA (adenine-N1)-methyltransferase [Thermoflexales bacterium]MDW8054466.1 tRNA (adenine-N1)-methyltransferase [Anaerolineae bacterium]MDW8292744.1 tRNA (adenine-N1)-methyltransferase [Anaerolineae bacterium]